MSDAPHMMRIGQVKIMDDLERSTATIPLPHKSGMILESRSAGKGIVEKTHHHPQVSHRPKWAPQTMRWKSIIALFSPAVWRGLLHPSSILNARN
ncbi:MAG TPA: hypothetical protein VMU16_12275 [Candidatus Binataceae bacterium]|nr:hypothetical protein [Candidatus Binataceae bacterium]